MIPAKLVLISVASTLLLNFAVQEAKGGNFVTLEEDTAVSVKLVEDVDAGALKEGDKVLMVVAEKVISEEYVLIDAGAPAKVTFMSETAAGKGTGFLNVSKVKAVDGQWVMLRAAPKVTEAAGDVDGVARLPIPVLEGTREIPKGTIFTVYISESRLIEE